MSLSKEIEDEVIRSVAKIDNFRLANSKLGVGVRSDEPRN